MVSASWIMFPCMPNHLDEARNHLDVASHAAINNADDAAKVDRWFRIAHINALLAIAQAIQDRQDR